MLSSDIIFVPFAGAVLMLEQPFFDGGLLYYMLRIAHEGRGQEVSRAAECLGTQVECAILRTVRV